MLACVCQPTDPNLFRRSPIPLGTPPLKIATRGAIPKIPGRGIRIIEPPETPRLTDEPESSTQSPLNEPLIEPNREALLSFGGQPPKKSATDDYSKKSQSKETSSDASSLCSSILSFSPVKKKCAKKYHVRHKHKKSVCSTKVHSDKENLSLSTENVDCDIKKAEEEEKNVTVGKVRLRLILKHENFPAYFCSIFCFIISISTHIKSNI